MKFKYLILIVIAMVWQSAWGMTREELMQMVAATNSSAPFSMGSLGTVTSVMINGDTVIYKASLEGAGSALIDADQIMKVDRQFFVDNLAVTSELSEQVSDFISELADCDVHFEMRFENPRNNSRAVIHITPEELEDILTMYLDYAKLAEQSIKESHKHYPLELSGMKIIDTKLQGSNVVTTTIVDEDIYYFDNLIKNQKMMKEALLDKLGQRADMSVLQPIYIFSKAGYNVEYRYIGSQSKREVSYMVTPKEVLDIVDEFE